MWRSLEQEGGGGGVGGGALAHCCVLASLLGSTHIGHRWIGQTVHAPGLPHQYCAHRHTASWYATDVVGAGGAPAGATAAPGTTWVLWERLRVQRARGGVWFDGRLQLVGWRPWCR